MNNLINDADMIELTGARMPRKQCDVLRKSGIRFSVRANGSPILTWDAYNQQLLSRDNGRSSTTKGFNLEAIK